MIGKEYLQGNPPLGVTIAHGALLTVKASYKCCEGQIYRIERSNLWLLQEHQGICLIPYEELQEQIEETERQKLYLCGWYALQTVPTNFRTVKWVHVHHTWMPGKVSTKVSQMWSMDIAAA